METQGHAVAQPRPSAFDEASKAWKQRDYQKTIELLRRASEQQPGNSKLLLNLGEAYGLRFDYEQAERWLETAVTVAPNKAEVLAEAGRRCQRFGQPGMANRFFRRTAEHPHASPWVLVALAEFEEGYSRTTEALALLQRALDLQPDYPDALVARARLHRLSGEFEAGEKLLRSMQPRAAGATSIKAWYELGTILDRQGNYDQAMAAFLEAKARLRPASSEYLTGLENLRADLRKVEKGVSANTLKRWVEASPELRPTRRFALLCGHPRSGTTLLEHVLDAHPDIVATDETSFLLEEAYPTLRRGFPDHTPMIEILESASVEALQRSRADYFRFTESFIGKSIGNRLLVDKNPALDVYIPLVARIFPEASFLVAIRDPRDVCLSCFMLPLPPGRLSALYLSLEQTVAQYVWVMGTSRAIRSKLPSLQLEIRYEDLVANLEGASRRLLQFLGVEWNEGVLRFAEHARTKLLRCAIDDSVAKPVFTSSIGRWRHYQKHLEPYLDQLEPFLEAFGYD